MTWLVWTITGPKVEKGDQITMCEYGDTVPVEVTVPAHLSCTHKPHPKVVPVDRCLASIIKALDTAGLLTSSCCCGHGRRQGMIMLADGRVLEVYGDGEQWLLAHGRHPRQRSRKGIK